MNVIAALSGARASILTGCAVAALCLPLGYCVGGEAARSRAAAERSAANVQALNMARTADEAEGVARVKDALENTAKQKELIDAIQTVPDTAPDDVRVALGCQRLRAAGTPSADLPAICRPSSGNGAQAAPAR